MGRVYALLVRSLVTRARLVALLAIAALGMLLGLVIRAGDASSAERLDAIAGPLVGGYGLNLVVPVCALVFAAAALGDPVEDRTLVYLWLTPVRRWRIVAAALAAALTVAVPVGVLPVVASVAVAGAPPRAVAGTAAGALLATVGYTAVFVGLGLFVKRALAWGLAYVLIWELAVARVAKGAARLSISVYSRSVLAEIADFPAPRNAAAWGTALVVLGAVAVLVPVLTTRLLARAEVA